jgi:hypothetical protein
MVKKLPLKVESCCPSHKTNNMGAVCFSIFMKYFGKDKKK